MKENKHYLIPLFFSLLVSILAYIFSAKISNTIETLRINSLLFTYSTTVFSLILTAYGIFFALAPLLRKDIMKSKDIKSVNKYFYVCLLFLLFQIIFSVALLFYNNVFILIINIFLFTFTIAMFFYIIKGIRAIFNIIVDED